MSQEAILCIPGPWSDRSAFIRAIITQSPMGEFMYAVGMLAHPAGNDHVMVDFCDPDPRMSEAFRIAGQGRVSEATLEAVQGHRSVLYLHLPLDWLGQRERLIKFTQVVQQAGGYAVKVESSGVAHEWTRWFDLLAGSTFDLYSSAVTLIGEEASYYSCGMHHFGLPECSLSRRHDPGAVADLMNQFNLYRIVEQPRLATGHTFSVSEEAQRYRLTLVPDHRHDSDDVFHNPHGCWVLE